MAATQAINGNESNICELIDALNNESNTSPAAREPPTASTEASTASSTAPAPTATSTATEPATPTETSPATREPPTASTQLSTAPIYITLTRFLPMFHERFQQAFPNYRYVSDLFIFYEASQCFIDQFKQVNVKPIAIRIRIKPQLNEYSNFDEFKIIDHKQILTICEGQPVIKFTETKRRKKPAKKTGIYVLYICSEQQSFENKEGETIYYYPSETDECNDRISIKWIRDRVITSNKPRRLDTSLHV